MHSVSGYLPLRIITVIAWVNWVPRATELTHNRPWNSLEKIIALTSFVRSRRQLRRPVGHLFAVFDQPLGDQVISGYGISGEKRGAEKRSDDATNRYILFYSEFHKHVMLLSIYSTVRRQRSEDAVGTLPEALRPAIEYGRHFLRLLCRAVVFS